MRKNIFISSVFCLIAVLSIQSREASAYSTSSCTYPIPAGLQYPGLNSDNGSQYGAGYNSCGAYSYLEIPGNGTQRLMDAMPPAASVPANCADPSAAQSALSAWTSDFEQLLSYGGTPQQNALGACDSSQYSNVVIYTQSSWCDGKTGTHSGLDCVTQSQWNKMSNTFHDCMSKYTAANPSAASNDERFAQYQQIQNDEKAFTQACKASTAAAQTEQTSRTPASSSKLDLPRSARVSRAF